VVVGIEEDPKLLLLLRTADGREIEPNASGACMGVIAEAVGPTREDEGVTKVELGAAKVEPLVEPWPGITEVSDVVRPRTGVVDSKILAPVEEVATPGAETL
jgi:hypothetical protein